MSAGPGGPRVLVTGVGGAPGFDLARCLLARGHSVIGADANSYAAGFRIPGIAPVALPLASDANFGTALAQVCRDLRPEAVLVGVECELRPLLRMGRALHQIGVRAWLPSIEAVDACTDKAVLSVVLGQHGIAAPRTFLPSQLDQVPEGRSLVVKPRHGHGSQRVTFCTGIRQAAVLCELTPEPIIQEEVKGQEFTADCLVDRAGRASVILRHRLVVKGGLAVVASTFHDEDAAELVKRTLAAAGVTGVCCVQGFLTAEGAIITEVNARIAGCFTLSEAAGADLVGQTLNGLFRRPVDHDRLTYRAGVRMTKHFETLAVDEGTPA